MDSDVSPESILSKFIEALLGQTAENHSTHPLHHHPQRMIEL